MSPFRSRQLPGRVEALRLVIRQGAENSSPELRHLAGLDARFSPKPTTSIGRTVSFSNSAEFLSPLERDELSF